MNVDNINDASKGLFITKKRYALLYYDKEGKRTDVDGKEGKMKAMGLDLKRSDTPVFVQDFLSEILYMVLSGNEEKKVSDTSLVINSPGFILKAGKRKFKRITFD